MKGTNEKWTVTKINFRFSKTFRKKYYYSGGFKFAFLGTPLDLEG